MLPFIDNLEKLKVRKELEALMNTNAEITRDKASQLYNEEEYEEAFNYYKKLAEQGDIDCQQFLGWLYESGIGTDKNTQEAENWYLKSAKLGSRVAQFYLAKLLVRKRYPKDALGWFRKSASTNYIPALYRLGWMHEFGRGMPVETQKALEYYKKASDMGHIFALRNYAILCIKGHKGFFTRFLGCYLFTKAICLGAIVGAQDHESDRLRT